MIEINQLSKHYGDLRAVHNVSFSLVPGEVLGFLGPNGAGKSTTMKMLTGYLRPTAGEVKVWGADVWQDPMAAQRHIGYLPEGAPAYEEMTALEFLSFMGAARSLRGQPLDQALDRVIDVMSLAGVLNQPIDTLSKGYKRRVGLAQAIIHDPDVLILDEPTDGLDPNQKQQVRDMIRGLSADKIVIISTHLLEEVSAVCNRVIVLSSGEIVSDSTPSELYATSRYHGAITISLESSADLDNVKQIISHLPGVESAIVEGSSVIAFPAPEAIDLIGVLQQSSREHRWPVTNLYVEQGRLDEVFRRLTTGGAS